MISFIGLFTLTCQSVLSVDSLSAIKAEVMLDFGKPLLNQLTIDIDQCLTTAVPFGQLLQI